MPKIAIVHEWFNTIGGSEKVVEQLLQIFPQADIFGLIDFLPIEDRAIFGNRKIQTSFLQKAPFISVKNYRNYLPLMPMAIEQFDLSGSDIVISNCHAVTKGVITNPNQLHISYIHTPMRYAWDMQNSYLETSGFGTSLKNIAARVLLHYIRLWDLSAASRPDVLIANSNFIARRIRKVYRRDSTVIYPPVDTVFYTPEGSREDFYLAASRFVPYKRLDLILKAFQQMPDKKLILIGDGPDLPRLRPFFGKNVTWLGHQSASVLRDHFRRCRGFLFSAMEDFGIMPVEAQACGAPVIAFGSGGVRDTVREGETGVFFKTQSIADIQAALIDFELQSFDPHTCRMNAERFSQERFCIQFQAFVQSAWESFDR